MGLGLGMQEGAQGHAKGGDIGMAHGKGGAQGERKGMCMQEQATGACERRAHGHTRGGTGACTGGHSQQLPGLVMHAWRNSDSCYCSHRHS